MMGELTRNQTLWCYGASLEHRRIAFRVQNTKDGNHVIIDEVKYPIGKSLRKRSANFLVDFLMDLRILLNTKEGGFYCADKLIAQSSVLFLVPPKCRRKV